MSGGPWCNLLLGKKMIEKSGPFSIRNQINGTLHAVPRDLPPKGLADINMNPYIFDDLHLTSLPWNPEGFETLPKGLQSPVPSSGEARVASNKMG